MKLILTILLLVFAVMPALAQQTNFNTNTLVLGDGVSSTKTVKFKIQSGSTQPAIRYNSSTGVMEFSNDGSTFNEIQEKVSSYFIHAKIGGANPSLGTFVVGSYTDVADGSLTMTPLGDSAAVGIPCSGTNSAATPSTSPTTCSAGNEVVGAAFTIPSVGTYKACISFTHYFVASVGTTITGTSTFQLFELTNASTTVLQDGIEAKQHSIKGSLAGDQFANMSPIDVCSFFKFTTTGTKVIKLRYTQPDASNVNVSRLQDLSSTGIVVYVTRIK